MTDAEAELWGAVKRAYEAGAETIAHICATYQISAGRLRRRAKRDGWRRRKTSAGQRKRTAGTKKRSSESSGNNRAQLVRRLYARLAHHMTLAERDGAQEGEGSEADRERRARTLSTLARTLEKLIELERGLKQANGETTGAAAGKAGSSAPDDLEQFRNNLAQRIARLGGNAGTGAGSGDVDAGGADTAGA